MAFKVFSRYMRFCFYTILFAGLTNAVSLDITDADSVRNASKTIANGLMAWYKGNTTGGTPGILPGPYYWWEAGGMFGHMINYWYYTGDTYYNDIVSTAILFQTGTGDDFLPANQTKDEGNDDQVFWAFTAMDAAELNFPEPTTAGTPSWLSLAQAVFNEMAGRWDTSTCGGGLRWQIYTFNAGYDYKNSISNLGLFQLAARLARYTDNSTYTDWAEKTWDWYSQASLWDAETYQIFDGTTTDSNCTSVDHFQWTYNYAAAISGAAYMYNHTSDENWLEIVSGMIPLPNGSAFPSTVGGSFPGELNSLVDFVADDDRPTFILDHATTQVLYRNNAFDALVATDSESSSSPLWLASLLEAVCHGIRPSPRTTETLPTFADRSWSRKSIGTSWTAVSCLGQKHHGLAPVAAPQGFGRPDANPLKRQESDTGSTTSASTDHSSIASSDLDTPFEQLAVDWFLSPRPSSDAYYDLLINHNWQDQTVGPIHSWDPMMRQMFSTILASEEPRVLLWGNDLLNLYNKHARPVYGDTFPGSLGIPLEQVWGEAVTGELANLIRSAYAVVYTTAGTQWANTYELEASCNVNFPERHPPPAIITALESTNGEVFVLQRSKNTLPPSLAVPMPDVGSVDTAYVLPIVGLDGVHVRAIAVLGLDPRRALSPSIRQFAESVRDMLFKSAALFSLPMEQRESKEISRALSQQLETMTIKAEESEQNFSRMLRDAPIGMCMHREDGHCVYVNDTWLELLGMSKGEFYKAAEVGLAWRDAVHEEDFEAVNQIWISALEKGTAASAEFRVKATCSEREVRWLEISAQQRHNKEGNLEYLYVWLRDISSRKQLAEQKLQDALETKRRSEVFIDMISHEMRNPLGAILLLADGIVNSLPPEATVLTPDLRHTLLDTAANIHLCANHMKQIAEEVLTFSRLDSKLLILSPEKIRPLDTVQSVLKMTKAELDYDQIQGSIEIQQSYIDLAIDNVLLDPGRLSQVILNLMTNAIKFTKGSSKRRIVISLGASRTKPTAKDCQVMLVEPREVKLVKVARRMSITDEPVGEDVFLVFSVRDTGCGLTETEMGHLFHRFSQASPKTYKQYGGSGLGLFISRELVELQGGQIGVHSESGKGSTFAFYVETARIEAPVETPAAQLAQTSASDHPQALDVPAVRKTDTPDLHVLVVEDNAINQKILAQQLRKTGCGKVHVADHGLDALEILSTTTFHRSSGVEQIPLSVILLDVEMPIMDGLTCARRIRELERAKEIVRHVPIIGITANARVEQIASCIEAGMDEVVTKPFRVLDLLPRMLALVDQHAPEAKSSLTALDSHGCNNLKDQPSSWH
ncbi:hypothetical protein E4T52_03577 [Aureobasidium sp. EXF-3400]|nr:hypothetical protein E4T52_03577 [Aureobasidium sp. EXF-3400]